MFRSQRPLMAEIWRNSLACNVGFPIRITTFMFFNYLLSPSNFTVIYKVSATPRTTHPSPKILVLLSSPTSRSSNSSLDYHPPWSRYSTQCDLWPQHGSASRSSKQRFLVHYNPILTQFYSWIYIPSSADVTSAMTLVHYSHPMRMITQEKSSLNKWIYPVRW